MLCNIRLRGAGEYSICPGVSPAPTALNRFAAITAKIAEYAMCGEMRYVIYNILNHKLVCEHILIRNVQFIRVNKKIIVKIIIFLMLPQIIC